MHVDIVGGNIVESMITLTSTAMRVPPACTAPDARDVYLKNHNRKLRVAYKLCIYSIKIQRC